MPPPPTFEAPKITPDSLPAPFVPMTPKPAEASVKFEGDFGAFLSDVGAWVDRVVPKEKAPLFRELITRMAINRNLVKS